MKQCIACFSEDITNVVENNRIFYFCKTCSSKNTRCIDSDTQFESKIVEGFNAHISVAALIRDNGKYLLIQRRDFPYGLSLPVGHVKFFEDADRAIKRKVLEETGLTLDSFKLIHTETFVDHCKYGADLHEWNVYNCFTSGQLVAGFESAGFVWADQKEIGNLDLTEPTRYILSKMGIIKNERIEKRFNLSTYSDSQKHNFESSLIQDLPFPVVVFSNDASIFQINKNASSLLGALKNQDNFKYKKITELLKQCAQKAIDTRTNFSQKIEVGESDFLVYANLTYNDAEIQYVTLTIKSNARNFCQEIDESLSFQTSFALTAKKNSLRAAETILKQYFYNSLDLECYGLYKINSNYLKKRIAHSNRSLKFKMKVELSELPIIQAVIKNRTPVTTIGQELAPILDYDPGFEHYLIVPVIVDDYVKAIIFLGKVSNRFFSEREIKNSQLVANKLGIVLEANELYSALSEERTLLSGILSTTTNGLIVIKDNGDIRYVNDAAIKMLNFSSRPNNFDAVIESFTDHNRRKFELLFNKVTENNETCSAEFVTSRRPYRNLQVFISPIIDNRGKSAETLLVFNNITGLKKREDKISDKNKKISTIIKNTADGIVVFDAKGRVVIHNQVNDLLKKLSGFKKNDERSLHKFFAQIYPDTTRFKDSDRYYDELKFKDTDKDDYWVGINYSCAKSKEGSILFVIATIRDIMRERVFNNKQKEFVYSITHELRTPITVIRGYISMILGGDIGKITPKQRVYFERVFRSTDKLVRLVEDILQAAKIENEKINMNIQSFSSKELVEEVITDFTTKAANKGLKLSIDSSSFYPNLLGDPDKVRQVLSNLVDNAIKYSIVGEVCIKVKTSGKLGSITVSDTGVGLTEKNQRLIFEKFYRVPDSLAVQEGGTGLGLYIAKSLVEKQGGTITVKSKINKGTQFEISLPIAE